MKLISMTDFVFNQINQKQSVSEFKESVKKYAELLKQTLNLGMFIPCDLEGNILEEPEEYNLNDSFYKMQKGFNDEVKHIEAKYRVLFNGLKIEKDMHHATKRTFYFIGTTRIALFLEFHSGEKELSFSLNHDNKTIEDLIKYDLHLTENAIKQLGL